MMAMTLTGGNPEAVEELNDSVSSGQGNTLHSVNETVMDNLEMCLPMQSDFVSGHISDSKEHEMSVGATVHISIVLQQPFHLGKH